MIRMLANTLILSVFFCFAAEAHAAVSVEQLIDEAGLDEGPVAMRDTPRWRSPKKVVYMPIGGRDLALPDDARGVELVRVTSGAELRRAAAGADAIIGSCNADVLAAAPQLSWVQIYSAGAERCLAADPVSAGSITLTNMQKMSSPVIAEHAIAMTLALGRGLTHFAKTMQDGTWERRPDTFDYSTAAGGTMLVVGLGGIGSETAKRAAALGMTVYATRNSSREGPDYVDYVGLSDELFELAGKADVIVNALPLTPATTGLFDAEFFAAAKTGALFISVGRGKSTVTADLLAAIESGQIGGAGLDVTDPEPLPPQHPLWQQPNVIITPHVSGSASNSQRHHLLAQENLRRFLAGDRLLNVVNPERGY